MAVDPTTSSPSNAPIARGDQRAGAQRPRPPWARRVRRGLLVAIGALYAASIPWYRSGASSGSLLGLPDWVAVALLCYATSALLNSVAWLLTDIPDPVVDPEEPEP